MKTLVIGCHEHLNEQYDLRFCKEACLSLRDERVVWQEITTMTQCDDYCDISDFDRVILVFQLTNYTTPALVNRWCEQAFKQQEQWQNKEIGAIVFTSEAAQQFRAGSEIGVGVDQLLLPLQIWANRYSYYLTPFVIYQWMQMTAEEKQGCLIELQQYMMLAHFDDINEQAKWYVEQLQRLLGTEDALAVNLCQTIEDNEFQLTTMNWV